jgi:competence protein ComGC
MLIENVIAMLMLAVISASFLPLIPNISNATESVRIHSKLATIGDYIGQHVHRWAITDPNDKPVSFSDYLTDGTEFDISGEKRVNSLLWTQQLVAKDEYMTDHFKASITFQDTARSSKRAVIRIVVWYDKNLNNTLDANERSFRFSTSVAELI